MCAGVIKLRNDHEGTLDQWCVVVVNANLQFLPGASLAYCRTAATHHVYVLPGPVAIGGRAPASPPGSSSPTAAAPVELTLLDPQSVVSLGVAALPTSAYQSAVHTVLKITADARYPPDL